MVVEQKTDRRVVTDAFARTLALAGFGHQKPIVTYASTHGHTSSLDHLLSNMMVLHAKGR
jgi:hypothetical protein